MELDHLVTKFVALFGGRSDVYGADHGECVRVPQGQTLWSLYRDHLTGDGPPIGIYPLRDDGRVVWGMTDFDHTDDPTDAFNIQAVLAHFGITSWVELTRSGHGFHVWVFADTWVDATTMRWALLAAHQIAEVKASEINPKQVSLRAGEVGNYARLPYPESWQTGYTPNRRRMVALGDRDFLTVFGFTKKAFDARTPFSKLRDLADLYIPPAPKRTVDFQEPTGELKTITDKMSPLTWIIFKDGPHPNGDRSNTLYRLVHKCREDGITPSEALAALRDADARWGKFFDRPDPESMYRKIVGDVYG